MNTSKVAKIATIIALVAVCGVRAHAFSPEAVGKLLSARNIRIGMICRKVGGKLSDFFASPERKAMNAAAREIKAALHDGEEDYQRVVRKYGCRVCQGRGGSLCAPAYPTFNGGVMVCNICKGEGFIKCTNCNGTGFPILAALAKILEDE